MCGIAGMIDLAGGRRVPPGVVEAMGQALVHRGPDEDGFLERPGLALANRRLSIVGLADGRQPLFNEDRTIGVVYNGELFDYPEQRAALEARGHRFVTHFAPTATATHGRGHSAKSRRTASTSFASSGTWSRLGMPLAPRYSATRQ